MNTSSCRLLLISLKKLRAQPQAASKTTSLRRQFKNKIKQMQDNLNKAETSKQFCSSFFKKTKM